MKKKLKRSSKTSSPLPLWKKLELAKYREIFVKQFLRRASYRWPFRNEALKRARIKRGIYSCSICFIKLKRSMLQMDHIDPVIDTRMGFLDWNTYVERLLPDSEGWQVLCKDCHQAKTKVENKVRRRAA